MKTNEQILDRAGRIIFELFRMVDDLTKREMVKVHHHLSGAQLDPDTFERWMEIGKQLMSQFEAFERRRYENTMADAIHEINDKIQTPMDSGMSPAVDFLNRLTPKWKDTDFKIVADILRKQSQKALDICRETTNGIKGFTLALKVVILGDNGNINTQQTFIAELEKLIHDHSNGYDEYDINRLNMLTNDLKMFFPMTYFQTELEMRHVLPFDDYYKNIRELAEILEEKAELSLLTHETSNTAWRQSSYYAKKFEMYRTSAEPPTVANVKIFSEHIGTHGFDKRNKGKQLPQSEGLFGSKSRSDEGESRRSATTTSLFASHGIAEMEAPTSPTSTHRENRYRL